MPLGVGSLSADGRLLTVSVAEREAEGTPDVRLSAPFRGEGIQYVEVTVSSTHCGSELHVGEHTFETGGVGDDDTDSDDETEPFDCAHGVTRNGVSVAAWKHAWANSDNISLLLQEEDHNHAVVIQQYSDRTCIEAPLTKSCWPPIVTFVDRRRFCTVLLGVPADFASGVCRARLNGVDGPCWNLSHDELTAGISIWTSGDFPSFDDQPDLNWTAEIRFPEAVPAGFSCCVPWIGAGVERRKASPTGKSDSLPDRAMYRG